jgi:hypothetical protein
MQAARRPRLLAHFVAGVDVVRGPAIVVVLLGLLSLYRRWCAQLMRFHVCVDRIAVASAVMIFLTIALLLAIFRVISLIRDTTPNGVVPGRFRSRRTVTAPSASILHERAPAAMVVNGVPTSVVVDVEPSTDARDTYEDTSSCYSAEREVHELRAASVALRVSGQVDGASAAVSGTSAARLRSQTRSSSSLQAFAPSPPMPISLPPLTAVPEGSDRSGGESSAAPSPLPAAAPVVAASRSSSRAEVLLGSSRRSLRSRRSADSRSLSRDEQSLSPRRRRIAAAAAASVSAGSGSGDGGGGGSRSARAAGDGDPSSDGRRGRDAKRRPATAVNWPRPRVAHVSVGPLSAPGPRWSTSARHSRSVSGRLSDARSPSTSYPGSTWPRRSNTGSPFFNDDDFEGGVRSVRLPEAVTAPPVPTRARDAMSASSRLVATASAPGGASGASVGIQTFAPISPPTMSLSSSPPGVGVDVSLASANPPAVPRSRLTGVVDPRDAIAGRGFASSSHSSFRDSADHHPGTLRQSSSYRRASSFRKSHHRGVSGDGAPAVVLPSMYVLPPSQPVLARAASAPTASAAPPPAMLRLARHYSDGDADDGDAMTAGITTHAPSLAPAPVPVSAPATVTRDGDAAAPADYSVPPSTDRWRSDAGRPSPVTATAAGVAASSVRGPSPPRYKRDDLHISTPDAEAPDDEDETVATYTTGSSAHSGGVESSLHRGYGAPSTAGSLPPQTSAWSSAWLGHVAVSVRSPLAAGRVIMGDLDGGGGDASADARTSAAAHTAASAVSPTRHRDGVDGASAAAVDAPPPMPPPMPPMPAQLSRADSAGRRITLPPLLGHLLDSTPNPTRRLRSESTSMPEGNVEVPSRDAATGEA